jgi:hypothetical protein
MRRHVYENRKETDAKYAHETTQNNVYLPPIERTNPHSYFNGTHCELTLLYRVISAVFSLVFCIKSDTFNSVLQRFDLQNRAEIAITDSVTPMVIALPIKLMGREVGAVQAVMPPEKIGVH